MVGEQGASVGQDSRSLPRRSIGTIPEGDPLAGCVSKRSGQRGVMGAYPVHAPEAPHNPLLRRAKEPRVEVAVGGDVEAPG